MMALPGPCTLPRRLEKGPLWDQTWVKDWSKMQFSKCGRESANQTRVHGAVDSGLR